jgi:hypothetical protein
MEMIIYQAELLLSSPVATLLSSFCSLLSKVEVVALVATLHQNKKIEVDLSLELQYPINSL